MGFKEKIREGLEKEVCSDKVQKIFLELQKGHPVLNKFKNAFSLIKDIHNKKVRSFQEKDKIISIFIREYQNNPGARNVYPFLLLLFWPAVDHIFNSKKIMLFNEVELWSQIHWAFINTILRYPLAKRPQKIAINIKLDTLNKVCSWQREEYKHQKVIILSGAEKDLDQVSTNNDLTGHEISRAQMFLQHFVDEKIIKEVDYYLILGTRIYGAELKEYAVEHGFTLGAVKMRRQRAEKVIRKHFKSKKNKKNCFLQIP